MMKIEIKLADLADLELFDRMRDDADFDWPIALCEDDTDVEAGALVFEGNTHEVLTEFADWLVENFELSFRRAFVR